MAWPGRHRAAQSRHSGQPRPLHQAARFAMRYLVDSDWVADWLNGIPQAVSLLRPLLPQGVGISSISLGELYEGVFYGRDPQTSERVLLSLLRGLTILSITRLSARSCLQGGARL